MWILMLNLKQLERTGFGLSYAITGHILLFFPGGIMQGMSTSPGSGKAKIRMNTSETQTQYTVPKKIEQHGKS